MQTIYRNGTILTMETGKTAEAVLTENGKILAVGDEASVFAAAKPGARQFDLEHGTLMPSFIDAHSHISSAAVTLLQVSLEDCCNFDAIAEKIRGFIQQQKIPAGQWVTANGYDHNTLQEHQHPTKELLDRSAPQNPVLIAHQSGHMGVANSLALQKLGISANTKDPDGGKIVRENGHPTGLLEEAAYVSSARQVPMPAPEDLLNAYRRVQRKYASYGITTVQEGMMVAQMEPLYRMLLSTDVMKLDLVAYPALDDWKSLYNAFPQCGEEYFNHIRFGGIKMILDGSPQGRTAWMRTPYEGEDNFCGYPALKDEAVLNAVREAKNHGMQILAHCNGDAACNQFLCACTTVAQEQGSVADIRPVMIHAQLLGLDQLDEVKRLSVIPSFFVAHAYHWGDIHIRNFGFERAARISPAASALQKGIRFTFHQDTPVIEPDMLETVWSAVCRQTKSGVVLGKEERISVYEALRAVTINAAYQYFEEEKKGSIAAGKQADFVVLDHNPLQMEPERLREIHVRHTIKDDEVIYTNS